MATFVLGPGEVELHREHVSFADGAVREKSSGRLLLTTHRLVAFRDKKPSAFGQMFGLFGVLAAAASQDSNKIAHEIRRERFVEVIEVDRKVISFHDDGTGYGHTAIAIVSRTPIATWQDRMHQWAAGTTSPVPLPAARLVETKKK